MYYKISAKTNEDGEMIGYKFDDFDTSQIEFDEGHRLYPFDHPSAKSKQKEPTEIIRLNVKPGRESAPLPDFISQPKPVMSKALLEVLRANGVNNIDAYPAEYYYTDGRKMPGEYFIVNVVGLVAAADLSQSVFEPDQPNSMIAMSFDSLVIDESKTFNALMFRLAENISTILVHENVVKAVEEAGIPYVEFYKTEDIAIL